MASGTISRDVELPPAAAYWGSRLARFIRWADDHTHWALNPRGALSPGGSPTRPSCAAQPTGSEAEREAASPASVKGFGCDRSDASTEPVSVVRVEVGDLVTIPGTSMRRCRVRLIRSSIPGVVGLYLTDSTTGHRLRRHIVLPLNQRVLRHRTAPEVDHDQQ